MDEEVFTLRKLFKNGFYPHKIVVLTLCSVRTTIIRIKFYKGALLKAALLRNNYHSKYCCFFFPWKVLGIFASFFSPYSVKKLPFASSVINDHISKQLSAFRSKPNYSSFVGWHE